MLARTPTVLILGAVVSAPILILNEVGLFQDARAWLALRLPGLLILPEGQLTHSVALQYLLHTSLAYAGAALGMTLEAAWKKYLFLAGLSFLLLLLTPILALNGILFEPFSAILAASFSMLLAVLLLEAASGGPDHSPASVMAQDPAPTKLPAQPAEPLQESPAAVLPQIVAKANLPRPTSQEESS
jgi:hypothetical protein